MLNALAAIAIATELGVEDEVIQQSLNSFKGIGRRFEQNGELALKGGIVTLIDDYGHHPRELQVTFDAAQKAWPDRRLVVIFQPHRFSRTRDLFEDFVRELSRPHVLVLLEVYSAGEAHLEGADGRALSRAIRSRGQADLVFVEHQNEVSTLVAGLLKPGDVLLTLGAGSVGRLATDLKEALVKQLDILSGGCVAST